LSLLEENVNGPFEKTDARTAVAERRILPTQGSGSRLMLNYEPPLSAFSVHLLSTVRIAMPGRSPSVIPRTVGGADEGPRRQDVV